MTRRSGFSREPGFQVLKSRLKPLLHITAEAETP